MQHALLARGEQIEVMADTGREERAVHPVSRPRAGVRAEAAVQAREMRSDGWPWMASREASLRAGMASHWDVKHGTERPNRHQPRLVCFVCGA